MRVLRVSHSAVVDAWRTLDRDLRSRGNEVRTLSANAWDEFGRTVQLEPRPAEEVEGVRTWGRHPALFVYDPRVLWRAMGHDWDVIDIHEEPFALATAQVLAIGWLRRVRSPYCLYSAQNIRKRYPIPFRWFERAALRGAAGLSVCNREAGEICQDKGFPGRPRLIGLGFDPAIFHPVAWRPVSDGRVQVGYAGRLASHKGVDVLIKAVLADERLALRIAGDGPQAAELRSLASKAPDRISFAGALDTARLADFYRSVDVVAVPSLTTPGWVEQFGRVAVEAMACGTPVVASDSGALPDVVGQGGLLVPPGDAQALRSALLAVADPQTSAGLRERGLATAAAYTWAKTADQYEELYRAMRPDLPRAKEPGVETKDRRVEVIVVAYHHPELLRRAIEPLRALPLIVVDNSSRADIAALCAELGVRYLDSGRNGGFASGVNIGLAHRLDPQSDVLLLNPDAVVSSDGVSRLQTVLLSDKRLASVGPAQTDEDGELARVAWPFPSPLGTWLEAIGLGGLRRSHDFVIGSVLLLRAEAIAQVGGLDERFFLYAEETDWARRAHKMGWRHAVVPEVTAAHIGAATSGDPLLRETHFHASQERYLRKHFGPLGWALARLGQVCGATARSVVLPGERGRAAARRARLYLRGPVAAEHALKMGPAR